MALGVLCASNRRGLLGDDELSLEVDVNDEIPLIVSDLGERAHGHDARVVHHVVETAPARDRLLECDVHRGAVTHVDLERGRSAVARSDAVRSLARLVRGARHCMPLRNPRRKPSRDRPTDARTSAGDERDATGVTFCHRLAWSTSTMKSMSPRKYVA